MIERRDADLSPELERESRIIHEGMPRDGDGEGISCMDYRGLPEDCTRWLIDPGRAGCAKPSPRSETNGRHARHRNEIVGSVLRSGDSRLSVEARRGRRRRRAARFDRRCHSIPHRGAREPRLAPYGSRSDRGPHEIHLECRESVRRSRRPTPAARSWFQEAPGFVQRRARRDGPFHARRSPTNGRSSRRPKFRH